MDWGQGRGRRGGRLIEDAMEWSGLCWKHGERWCGMAGDRLLARVCRISPWGLMMQGGVARCGKGEKPGYEGVVSALRGGGWVGVICS